jgi:hypothetical protein
VTGLTYDSGALIGADKADRRVWALHRRALERGSSVTVPSVVLAECWRGHTQMARFLKGCHVEALQDGHARRAGTLLGLCRKDLGAIDAVVVEGALRRGDAVVTSAALPSPLGVTLTRTRRYNKVF